MPEAPEIEILKNQLRREIFGLKLHEMVVFEAGKSNLPARTPHLLKGARCTEVDRFGKMLLLHFDVGLTLVLQLMMVGQLRLMRQDAPLESATVLQLEFERGKVLTLSRVSLRYTHLAPRQALHKQSFIAKSGLDVLSADFVFGAFCEILDKKEGMLKPLLLQQKYFIGLGNTYTDEILFAARLHPRCEVSHLEAKARRRLFGSINKELRQGLALAGSSEMNFVDLYGSPGNYHKQFKVKRRSGLPCYRCRSRIERALVNGKGSYYCPICQILL